MKRAIITSLSLAIFFALCPYVQANTDNCGQLIAQGTTIITEPGTEIIYEKRTTTVDGVTTTTESTTTKEVPGTAVTADVFVTTLEGRRLALEAAIAAGQGKGTISAAQAKSWRAELDAIARVQAESKSTLTYQTALPLAMSLDRIAEVVFAGAPTVTYVPMISGRRFIVEGGRVIMLDDIMVRRADLESKISQKLAAGKLTNRQAQELRRNLGSIAVIEADMRAHAGPDGFTPKQSRELYKAFDQVGSRLDKYSR